MNNAAKSLLVLYKMNKITISGLSKAVMDGVITPDEFKSICGKEYI